MASAVSRLRSPTTAIGVIARACRALSELAQLGVGICPALARAGEGYQANARGLTGGCRANGKSLVEPGRPEIAARGHGDSEAGPIWRGDMAASQPGDREVGPGRQAGMAIEAAGLLDAERNGELGTGGQLDRSAEQMADHREAAVVSRARGPIETFEEAQDHGLEHQGAHVASFQQSRIGRAGLGQAFVESERDRWVCKGQEAGQIRAWLFDIVGGNVAQLVEMAGGLGRGPGSVGVEPDGDVRAVLGPDGVKGGELAGEMSADLGLDASNAASSGRGNLAQSESGSSASSPLMRALSGTRDAAEALGGSKSCHRERPDVCPMRSRSAVAAANRAAPDEREEVSSRARALVAGTSVSVARFEPWPQGSAASSARHCSRVSGEYPGNGEASPTPVRPSRSQTRTIRPLRRVQAARAFRARARGSMSPLASTSSSLAITAAGAERFSLIRPGRR